MRFNKSAIICGFKSTSNGASLKRISSGKNKRIRGQTGIKVDFQEPWFKLVIQENIEAKQMEIGSHMEKRIPCYAGNCALDGEESFDNKILDSQH